MRMSTLILSYLTAFCVPVWFCSIILQLWDFSTKGPIFSSPCISSLTYQMISTTPSRSTSPSPNHTVTCGSHDGHVYCLNGSDGSLLWQFQTTGKVFSTPFVFDGAPWGLRTLAAVCSTDGKLWVLDGETGTLKATLSLPGELFSSPVVWGHNLVVGCRNDYVYCLELTKRWLIIIIHVQLKNKFFLGWLPKVLIKKNDMDIICMHCVHIYPAKYINVFSINVHVCFCAKTGILVCQVQTASFYFLYIFHNICVTFSLMDFSKVNKISAISTNFFVSYHIQHCLRYAIAHDQCKNKVTWLQFRSSPKEYSPFHFTSIHTYIPTYITYIQHYIR